MAYLLSRLDHCIIIPENAQRCGKWEYGLSAENSTDAGGTKEKACCLKQKTTTKINCRTQMCAAWERMENVGGISGRGIIETAEMVLPEVLSLDFDWERWYDFIGTEIPNPYGPAAEGMLPGGIKKKHPKIGKIP